MLAFFLFQLGAPVFFTLNFLKSVGFATGCPILKSDLAYDLTGQVKNGGRHYFDHCGDFGFEMFPICPKRLFDWNNSIFFKKF